MYGTKQNLSDSKELGWAWVAGASEGLGLAFATGLAQRGYRLLLFARRAALLTEVAADLSATHGVVVTTVALDMAQPELEQVLLEHIERHPPAIGIYNAAYVPVGEFLQQPLQELEQAVNVNARGPLSFCHVLGRAMLARGGNTNDTKANRGAIVLMSSLAGMQGSARLATYSATKAFNNTLGEALWAELRAHGIQVVTCIAGAIQTPGYEATAQDAAPGTLTATQVAQQTLAALEQPKRGPILVPGWVNRFAYFLLGRWLPRRHAISIMARSTASLKATSTAPINSKKEGA